MLLLRAPIVRQPVLSARHFLPLLFWLNIFIHISFFIVICKYAFNDTTMVGYCFEGVVITIQPWWGIVLRGLL